MLVEITDGLAVNLYAEKGASAEGSEAADQNAVVDLTDVPSHKTSGSPSKPMLEVAWPALLASLSFVIGTNLADDLFERVLKTFKTLITMSDGSDLLTCRDAFLNTLSRFAVPPTIVKATRLSTEPPPTPGLAGGDSFKITPGTGTSARGPGLSDRNLSCLTALIDLAEERGDTLDSAWHDILETVQNAVFVLGKQAGVKRAARQNHESMPGSPRFSTSSGRPNNNASQPSQALLDAEPSSVQGSVCHLMNMTSRLSDNSYQRVIAAICELSEETIGLDRSQRTTTREGPESPAPPSNHTLPPVGPLARRTSGLSSSQAMRQGERCFALMMLDVAVSSNVERIITQSLQTVWDTIVSHTVEVAQHQPTPAVVRMQAAEVLGNMLDSATTHLEMLGPAKQSLVQKQIFEALSQQVQALPSGHHNATDLEIRTRGLITLSTILESSGHTIASVWPSVFRIIDNVSSTTKDMLRSGGSQANKAQVNLVRTAYPSLNLACSDYLSTFDANTAQDCLDSLCKFANQQFDMNIALSSIGSIWNLMDAFQSGLIDISLIDQDRLWLRSLDGLLLLTSSKRDEVRASAVQTMFRSLETHGSYLSDSTWNVVITGVLLPLLDKMVPMEAISEIPHEDGAAIPEDGEHVDDTDESYTLALKSIASLCQTYSSRISASPGFILVVERSFAVALRACAGGGTKTCSAALRLCQQLVSAFNPSDQDDRCMEVAWATIEGIHRKLEAGQAVTPSEHNLTQDNLQEYMRLLEVIIGAVPDELSGSHAELLLRASRSAVTYTRSPTYPLDCDNPSPLQQAGLDILSRPRLLDRCPAGSIVSAFAEYVTLAFVGGFDYIDTSLPGARRTITKKVCYVGLAKATMAIVASYVNENSHALAAAIRDGGIERLLGSLTLPIKLRQDCPPANKFGKDPALWKTATLTFFEVIKRVIPLLETASPDDLGPHWDSLWQQIVMTFRSILLVDDSYIVDMEVEDAEDEEVYDIPAIDLFEMSVVPLLGHSRMDSVVLERVSDMLYQASILYTPCAGLPSRDDRLAIEEETSVTPLPRQALRYRCLGLLFASVRRYDKGESPLQYQSHGSC